MVEYDGKLLFLRRHSSRRYPGKWGCPAGGQEPGETIAAAALRELKEETGISALEPSLHYCGMRFVRYPADQDFIYHLFWLVLCTEPHIILNPGEHDKFAWVAREEAGEVDYLGGKGDINACLQMIPVHSAALRNF